VGGGCMCSSPATRTPGNALQTHGAWRNRHSLGSGHWASLALPHTYTRSPRQLMRSKFRVLAVDWGNSALQLGAEVGVLRK
jgi:hypothetical protein